MITRHQGAPRSPGAPWWVVVSRAHLWCPQDTRARQAPQARPGGWWAAQPTFGAHLLVYKSFLPRKTRRGLSGRSAAVSRRKLGRSTFALPGSDSAGGTFLPEGEIVIIIITNNSPIIFLRVKQLSHLGEGNLHQHLQQHHLISNPSSSLVFNLCTETLDLYLWVTSSVVTSCS